MTYPVFATFFAAVHTGLDPLPWQARLADTVVTSGWPTEIGVPTGLGKTATIDIAVWALGAQANLAADQRRLPTRMWYVVNRRLLVDAAHDHGQRLHGLLQEPGASNDPAAVATVADALRSLNPGSGDEDPPLAVTRLRGGAELGARPAHPAQPALLFATVPMYASAWLFRGYTSSRSMRPVDAAHAGIDSLVLLDEAHLSRPLQQLLDPMADCDVGEPATVVPTARARPAIVALTATGDATDPFHLDDRDRAHPIVQQRLQATKPVRLVETKTTAADVGRHVAGLVTDEVDSTGPSTIGVFLNTPSRARAVYDALSSTLETDDLVLLTGRMRRPEADRARRLVLDPQKGAPAGRDRTAPRHRHLVVVATQTLEVGADLDFDVLVTENCGRRALTQRLGRLNRLGQNPDARGYLVHPGKEHHWGLYGTEPTDVWAELTAKAVDEIVDLGPARLPDVLGAPSDLPPRVAELLPGHLWELAKTTNPPAGEAPIELFYEGFDTDGPRLSLCWRTLHLQPGERLIPLVHVDEAVDVPLWEARTVLDDTFGPDHPLTCLAADRITVTETTPAQLRPGDVVILHTNDGLYDQAGWSPTSNRPVEDLSLPRLPSLPLDVAAITHFSGVAPDQTLGDVIDEIHSDDPDLDTLGTELRSLLRTHGSDDGNHAWRELAEQLTNRIHWTTEPARAWLELHTLRRRRAVQVVTADAFDELSATLQSVNLDDHLTSVGELARRIATVIGLPDVLVDAVTAAGRFHDIGKADPRFQRWLQGTALAQEPAGIPLAKSDSPWWRWDRDRAAAGWPRGGRHEALSAKLVTAWLHEQPGLADLDEQLVVHLVASHHGYARPLIPPVEDPAPATCSWAFDGHRIATTTDLSETDWDQPARFRACCERYGYWGLALLEAVLRQADHVASQVAVA